MWHLPGLGPCEHAPSVATRTFTESRGAMDGLCFADLTNPWPENWPDPRTSLPTRRKRSRFPTSRPYLLVLTPFRPWLGLHRGT